jgi:glutathione S-transferase
MHMKMGGGMGMNGMDMSKMSPMKFEYFPVHGRGLQIKFVLLYAKYCMWKDCPMPFEEFAKAK